MSVFDYIKWTSSNILYALLYPLFCISVWTFALVTGIFACLRPKNIVKRHRAQPAKPPTPLPRLRRALTIPLPGGRTSKKTEQRTSNQEQSLYFKLPPELRDTIYRDILVFPTQLHVWRTHRRLCSVPCALSPDSQCFRDDLEHRACRPPFAKDCTAQRRGRFRVDRPQERFLPMLTTCRRMYTETIDILYTRNRFSVEDQNTFLLLPTLLPTRRFNSIRFLYLHFHVFRNGKIPREAEVQWERFCEILAGIPHLEDLCIALAFHRLDPNASFQMAHDQSLSTFLKPLTKVRAKKFVVQIPLGWKPTEVIDGDAQTFSIENKNFSILDCYCCPTERYRSWRDLLP